LSKLSAWLRWVTLALKICIGLLIVLLLCLFFFTLWHLYIHSPMLSLIASAVGCICFISLYLYDDSFKLFKHQIQSTNGNGHADSKKKIAPIISTIRAISRVIGNRWRRCCKTNNRHKKGNDASDDSYHNQKSDKSHCKPPITKCNCHSIIRDSRIISWVGENGFNRFRIFISTLVASDLPPRLAAPALRIQSLYKHTPLAFCDSMSCAA